MTSVLLNLPRDVAESIFRHLNHDDGWRAKIADLLVRADAHAPNPGARRKADDLRALVIALGVLSGQLARALQQGNESRPFDNAQAHGRLG